MFDNITAVAILRKPLDFSKTGKILKIGQLEFIVQYDKQYQNIKNYQALVRNLQFTVTQEEIKISNSLHKFYCGNNYSDYNADQLAATIKDIEFCTGILAEEFIIKKIECSLNIVTESDAVDYLPMFLEYRTVFPQKVYVGKKPYGINYNLTDYRIKIYSKNEELKRTDRITLTTNILRFEIQIRQNRLLKEIFTLKDLASRNVRENVFDFYFKIFGKIKTKGIEDFSRINQKHLALYYAGKIGEYWNEEKKHNVNTAKSKRKLYLELLEQVNQETPLHFLDLLRQKFAELN